MLARILIGIFYASVFFVLGAWTGGHVKPVERVVSRGAVAVQEGAQDFWVWAFRRQTPVEAATEKRTPSSGQRDLVVADLGAARAAFSNGDLKGAIMIYRAYLATHPEDADAHGELGNVYYNSGQTAEAAEAFHAAALRLIAEGRTAQARALEPAVRAEAPALADDIARRLAETSTNVAGVPAAQTTIDRMQ